MAQGMDEKALKRQKYGIPTYSLAEELLNSISHGIGAGLGIAALVLCIVKSAHAGDGYKLASSIVFGLTTTLLYLMSCLYHALKVNRAKKVFRVFDHCTIFLLIAGTYTPYTLVTLRGPAGWVMFGIVWAVAITGVVLNAVNLKKFAKISVVCYVALGWVILLATKTLEANLATAEASLHKTTETLRTAESQLAQARDDLQHALDTGDIDEVRRIIGDNPAAIAQFLAAPTHLERHAVYPMADNGSAMSPFYTSLALWIGAIFMVALMSVTVSPARQAALTKKFGRAPRPLYLGRYGVFCLLGLAQALIVGLGNVFFLGVECEHFWLYLAACCLASVVFTNLVYTLTVSFGNIGKALAIIGLVLQLAGAGGLMPVQMLSAPLFQEIYPWLPFAHSMPALEGAMAGIYGDQYLVQMGLLAAILVPSLILGLVLRRPVIRLNDWVLAKLNETKFL